MTFAFYIMSNEDGRQVNIISTRFKPFEDGALVNFTNFGILENQYQDILKRTSKRFIPRTIINKQEIQEFFDILKNSKSSFAYKQDSISQELSFEQYCNRLEQAIHNMEILIKDIDSNETFFDKYRIEIRVLALTNGIKTPSYPWGA